MNMLLRFPTLKKVTVTFIVSKRNHECAVNMGIKSFLSQCVRTLKLAVKPGRDELWISIKISVLGIGVVGLVGFAIKLIGSFLSGGLVTLTAVSTANIVDVAVNYFLLTLGGV
jgi:protein translocase SEC61 complex gamma subunit